MNMCNIKGNFFVDGKTSNIDREYSEKIRDQFKYGLDLFSLDSIHKYYIQNGTYVEPANFHPMNDGNVFLPIRSFNAKESNLYFEDLAILAYITSFVNNTKDIDSFSFIKTKTMIDQSNSKEVFYTIPMKILFNVIKNNVGKEHIVFDFEKIEGYNLNERKSVYLSTMSPNTISIQEIYRVLTYIREISDACEFLFYCYTQLDENHKNFLTEISRTDSGSFPYIKYNPFTDELYILKYYGCYMLLDEAIDINAERMKQRLIRYIDSKNVFRIDVREYLEYIKKFVPNNTYAYYKFPDMLLKLNDIKRSGAKLDEVFDSLSFKAMAEFLINVLNKSTPKYLTDKFEVGADKFNNLKIKLYKV